MIYSFLCPVNVSPEQDQAAADVFNIVYGFGVDSWGLIGSSSSFSVHVSETGMAPRTHGGIAVKGDLADIAWGRVIALRNGLNPDGIFPYSEEHFDPDTMQLVTVTVSLDTAIAQAQRWIISATSTGTEVDAFNALCADNGLVRFYQ